MAVVKVYVRGRFKVMTSNGEDITPKFRKERALIALLCFSSENRASRAWLQSMLWSEKTPEKASASLRRALANLKKGFGAANNVLSSDRLEVWLRIDVQDKRDKQKTSKVELLENLDAPDDAFADWLRELRFADSAETGLEERSERQTDFSSDGKTIVVIALKEREDTDRIDYFDHVLVDTLAARFQSEGVGEIFALTEPPPERLKQAATVLNLEIVSHFDGTNWNMHLRALADLERRFLWSGRLSMRRDIDPSEINFKLQSFSSQVLNQIALRFKSVAQASRSPILLMQAAVSRIYFRNHDHLIKSEKTFETYSHGDTKGIAVAWRAFAKLVTILEFGGAKSEIVDQANSLAHEALIDQAHNPLVAAIASRIALDAAGDIELARFRAEQAVLNNDTNPYALLALSRVELLQGNLEKAGDLSRNARVAAAGLQHVFAWDMEVCLSSLSLRDFDVAYAAARSAYNNNPTHKAALRYMVALGYLRNDPDSAQRAMTELRRLEPDFMPQHLLRPDYPMLTLQRLGLADELPV